MNVVEVNHCIGKSIKYYVSIYANVRSYSSSLYDLIYYKKKKTNKKTNNYKINQFTVDVYLNNQRQPHHKATTNGLV